MMRPGRAYSRFVYGPPDENLAHELFGPLTMMRRGAMFVWAYLCAEMIERAAARAGEMSARIEEVLREEQAQYPDTAHLWEERAEKCEPIKVSIPDAHHLTASIKTGDWPHKVLAVECCLSETKGVCIRCLGFPSSERLLPEYVPEPSSIEEAKATARKIAADAVRLLATFQDSLATPMPVSDQPPVGCNSDPVRQAQGT